MKPLEVLQQHYGHPAFRGQQSAIIERVLQGRHSLVIMPTGMGKSVCYQIPALILSRSETTRKPLTLVLSPLIALMKDQVDSLWKRNIRATFVNSSLQRKERESRYQRIAKGDFDLLYVTPERFRKPEFLECLRQREIVLVAVDEAHCISQWGHDFRPDYSRVAEIRETIGNPATIALTATATPKVQADIVDQLGLEASEIKKFHEGIDRPNLALNVEHVWENDEKLRHIKRVHASHPGAGIVYFTLIKTLLEFSDRLNEESVNHLIYHGELERSNRRRVQDAFMEEEGHLVLATNAFGMGIDKEDIRFVIHADVPGSMESYYQEIGRAGRDGKPSECLLLYEQRDLATQMQFLEWSNPNAIYYQRLHALLRDEREKVDAFGFDWLHEKLHHKDKYNHQLETALAMLERHGVVEGTIHPLDLTVVSDLPDALGDDSHRDAKKRSDQEKLLALVQYANHDGDRIQFIHDYFGVERV